jgi:hypothetical protein
VIGFRYDDPVENRRRNAPALRRDTGAGEEGLRRLEQLVPPSLRRLERLVRRQSLPDVLSRMQPRSYFADPKWAGENYPVPPDEDAPPRKRD